MKILFLCVANSARSQIAEGLAKDIFDSSVTIASAGSNPNGTVNPFAIEVLQEKGIDTSEQWSKSINQLPDELINNLDFIVTLCAEEVCPIVISNAQRIHWPLPDPASAPRGTELETFRKTRDDISVLINSLKEKLNS